MPVQKGGARRWRLTAATPSASLIAVAASVMLLFPIAGAHSQPRPLTARELIETTDLSKHAAELEKGEIVIMSRPETESGNELNVIMAVLIPAPLKPTVDTLRLQSTAQNGPGMIAAGEIKGITAAEIDTSFATVGFTPEEKDEVERLMEVQPGDAFNFSIEDIALIRRRAATLKEKSGKAASQAMADALRDVLKGRYRSYRKDGLDGLAPYQFSSSKQVAPSDELIAATDAMRIVQERFPGYYQCLRYYPETSCPEYAHGFYWAKQSEAGRPLFLLKHWILDVQPDYALITERRYYLSHSLNSLQVVIGCLPDGDDTLVVLLNQTFTEKVNRVVGKTIAKTIGYREVEKNIRPIFANLRDALKR